MVVGRVYPLQCDHQAKSRNRLSPCKPHTIVDYVPFHHPHPAPPQPQPPLDTIRLVSVTVEERKIVRFMNNRRKVCLLFERIQRCELNERLGFTLNDII